MTSPSAPPPSGPPVPPVPPGSRWDAGLRPAGPPPYWEPGEVIWWHYRRRAWQPGDPETVHPMRVVQDDADALVAWLAGGTPILAPTLPDGRHVRTRPLDEMFRSPRVQGRMLWKGEGTLRVAPTGRPWSAWLFWDGGVFDGWYVNLETPHRRRGRHTYSADHVLDVLVAPDRSWRLKDEHELAAAALQGRYSPEEATAIRAEAQEAVAAVTRGDLPFGAGDEQWQVWRPDPTWVTPGLPADLDAAPGYVAASRPRTIRPGESRY